MTILRRARSWFAARGRFQFCVTVGMVVLLTGTCGALLMMPNLVPALQVSQPAAADSPGRALAGDDPRLDAVRRTLEPFGPVTAQRVPTGNGGESLVVGHPAQRAEMDVLEQELAPATTAVTDLWGPDWAQAAMVVVASTPSEFAALIRAGADMPTEIAAASVSDPFAPGTRPTGQRVVFSPDAGDRLDPAGLRTLLRHELTHIATRAQTVDGAPQWMLEGFADYAAHRGQEHRFAEIAPTLATRLRAGSTPADLPADAAFTGRDAAAGYEQAWSICAFVAQRYDEPRLVELYRRIAAGKQDAESEDRILRDVLGIARPDFVAGWRSWLGSSAA